ncbi:hypothetical protein L6R49_29785 [Myxococcota bacterium]|nr:hypothetical protein [Myxococcota bacterium]
MSPRQLMTAALVLSVALSLVVMGPAVFAGEAPGRGPDVVSTLWGMWWFQQALFDSGLSGETQLVNFPNGAVGSVLSPTSALYFALSEPLVGVPWASAIASLAQICPLVMSTAWLTLRLGGSPTAALVSALALFAGRPLMFDLGEGSVVAIAAFYVPLGFAVMLVRMREGASGAFWLAWCMGFTAVENPYLAPVLPAVGALRAALLFHRKELVELQRLLVGLAAGAALTVAVAVLFAKGASPDYPGEIAGQYAMLGPFKVPLVEMPWARTSLSELLIPTEVHWTLDVDDARRSNGGRYLGLSVVAMAVAGVITRPKASAFWACLAVFCALIAMGSVIHGVAGPFLFLNTLMDAVARPLTQPRRFLILTQIGLAICAGFGLDGLRALAGQYGRALAAGVLAFVGLDTLLLGGGALRMPGTEIPDAPCLTTLPSEPGDGVLVWPWDANDGDAGVSQLLQLAHERPSPHRGIASWALNDSNIQMRIRALGWRRPGPGQTPQIDWTSLSELGYRWVVVEPAADPENAAALGSLMGDPVAECGGYAAYSLPGEVQVARPTRRP